MLSITILSSIREIAFVGHFSIHFKHFTQVSLSTVWFLKSIQPEGHIFEHIEQDTHFSLSKCILFIEILESNPKTVPTGQIFVQNHLFLKNTSAKITRVKINPKRLKLKAEPNIV